MEVIREYFLLYGNCIPVRGASQAIICDLHLNRYIAIPFFLFSLFNKEIPIEIEKMVDLNPFVEKEEMINYFNFLEENDYGFFTDHPTLFPLLELNYTTPLQINNCVLDYDNDCHYDLLRAIHLLDRMGVYAIQIRHFDTMSQVDLLKLLLAMEGTDFVSIEILIRYNSDIDMEGTEELFVRFPRLRKLYLFNRSQNACKKIVYDNTEYGTIIETCDRLDSANQCGQIFPGMFHANIISFSEAMNFNSCLHKKVGIDIYGKVKNCPSFRSDFGNIKEIKDLEDVIASEEFQKLWYINKNAVKICSDCEFRYICTDCRAFTQAGELYGKPSKCGYDPYTGQWI